MPGSSTPSADQRLQRALAAWVDGVRRRPGLVLLLAAGLCAVCLAGAARWLGVNTDTETLFDEKLEFRQLEREFDRAFPMLEDPILVVLDGPSDARAAEAAEALAARLAAEPELYDYVAAPGTGPFFQRHALLYLDLADLEEVVDRLAAAQPFLAGFSHDPTLGGLLALVARAVERADTAAARGIDLEIALAQVEEAVRSASQLSVAPLVFDDLLVGVPRPGGGGRRYVIVQPRVDFGRLVPALAALRRMHEVAAELGFGPGGEVSARITGALPLNTEEMEVVTRQVFLAGAVSFLLVTGILFAALRTPRLVLATTVSLLAGLLWTAGFATVAVGHLNLISVSFTVLFIGLGVDFGIHFCLRYRELRGDGVAHAEALHATATGVGSSLCLCALTTAIGFLAFVPTGYRGVAELGLIAGVGMFVSLLASLTLLPAILSFGRGPEVCAVPRAAARAGASIFGLPGRHPVPIVALALAVGAASLVLAPQLDFDPNPLRVRDPNAESVKTFEELVAEGDLNPWSAELLAPDLERAEVLAARVALLPEVDRTVTLRNFVPADQPEKLLILEDARFFLNLVPLAGGRAEPADDAGERAALHELLEALESFVAGAAPSSLRAQARRVADEIAGFLEGVPSTGPAPPRFASLREALLVPVASGVADLQAMLDPTPVTLETLPETIRSRMLAPDGRARVQVFPVENLNDNDALRQFIAAVRSVSPRVAGDSVYMLESGRTIVRSLRQAFGSAAVLIVLVVWLLWRSGRYTLLVLAPILLAALSIPAFMVLAGMPLNFANVIVLPLLLGMGVDSGIHMVHRLREGDHHDLLATSTPRAVLASAVTTLASFGSLAFSSHRGIATLGQLLVLGLFLTLVANLIVLPAVIALTRARRR